MMILDTDIVFVDFVSYVFFNIIVPSSNESSSIYQLGGNVLCAMTLIGVYLRGKNEK